MLKKSHATQIAEVVALTDNFNPVTGRRLFDAAGTLQWLTLTGGMRDIKQKHCRQIGDWIRDAAQDEVESRRKMRMRKEHLELRWVVARR